MPPPTVKLKSFFTATILVIAILTFSTPSNAFFRNRLIGHLGMGRVDPIMSPGHPSAHVHHLNGAKNIGFNLDATDLTDSICTTSVLTQDKSAYWAPWMYFQHDNGNFEPVNLTAGITVYYKLEKRPDVPGANFTVFPKGFRMIAGSSPKRTWNGPWPVRDTSHWGPQDMTQSALAEKALGFNCLHYYAGWNEPTFAYPYLRDKAFIDQTCNDGVRAEVLFPSCWDGVNLDSDDHKSHVAYPPILQEGKCPDTHPVYLPILFYETIWNTPAFKDVPGQFVMANGDPTGFGYHGDFMSGWDDGVLEAVMQDPTCTSQDPYHPDTSISGEVEGCKTFEGHIQSDEEAGQCQMEFPQAIKYEKVQGLLSSLPGGVNMTGVRHDPGSPLYGTSSSLVASQASSDSSHVPPAASPSSIISTASPSSAVQMSSSGTPPSTSQVMSSQSSLMSTATPSPTTPNDLVTITTTFENQGYVIVMVLIENIETVVTVATPTTTETVFVNAPETSASALVPPTSPATTGANHLPHMRKHMARFKYGHRQV